MRAEGATRTVDGAPGREPLAVGDAGGAAAIAVHELRHSFGEREVLAGLSFQSGEQRVLGLVGPSGCGKSTLLELVAGLRDPVAGRIEVEGAVTPAERLRRCAYMPQRDLLLPWLSALDNAGLALRNRGASRAESRRTAAPLFERFGLEGFETARPAELSGGMRQRVAFLRTLVAGKPVLLLDEPFGALDAITRGEMQEWLAGALEAEPRAALLVTHDVEEALYLSDEVLVLSARPAREVVRFEVPSPRRGRRAERITSPELVALRERALRALEGGAG